MPQYEERLNRVMQPRIGNATHKMAAEVDDAGNWYAFPTIQQQPDGKLVELPLREAQAKAMKEGNYKSFGKDKEAALKYARGDYKAGTPIDDERNRQRMLAESLRGYR